MTVAGEMWCGDVVLWWCGDVVVREGPVNVLRGWMDGWMEGG